MPFSRVAAVAHPFRPAPAHLAASARRRGEAQGVNIYFYKYVGVIISGGLSGLGGAFIASQELSGIYKEGQTGGRGFIGLAALIFGNWRPIGRLRRRNAVRLSRSALKLQDLDGNGSHSLLLVMAIACWRSMVGHCMRKRPRRRGARRGRLRASALRRFRH